MRPPLWQRVLVPLAVAALVWGPVLVPELRDWWDGR